MNLVIIFGPPAVGKMTVAQELAKITDIKVFHNHLTIDFLTRFFDFESNSHEKLTRAIRRDVIEEAAKSGVNLAFSLAWNFSTPAGTEEIKKIKQIVEKENGCVYFVELEAPLNIRVARNKSENRLKHKNPANVQAIEKNIVDWDKKYQLNTNPDEFLFPEKYLRISTEHLSAADAAAAIKKTFKL